MARIQFAVTAPPAALTNLVATAVSASRIDLASTDNASTEDGFRIERSPDASARAEIDTVGANVTAYQDSGLSSNTTYHYRVRAPNAAGSSAYSNVASATTLAGGGEDVATGEMPVAGTASGSYTDTHADDGQYESIQERESGGKPRNRYSDLEHKWTFGVGAGSSVTFHLEAHRTASSDGDAFVFAYSTDDSTHIDMVTVTKTADDGQYQTFALPASLSGTVRVRVRDPNRTPGNRSKDTIFVDHMSFRSP